MPRLSVTVPYTAIQQAQVLYPYEGKTTCTRGGIASRVTLIDFVVVPPEFTAFTVIVLLPFASVMEAENTPLPTTASVPFTVTLALLSSIVPVTFSALSRYLFSQCWHWSTHLQKPTH